MKVRLAVLGGSSPFTAALVDSLWDVAPSLPALEMVLHGRDELRLRSVTEYARRRLAPLGWSVAGVTELGEALAGSFAVVHQIRYGGMAGRQQDEELASCLGAPADETLGPAALHRALLSLAGLQRVTTALLEHASDAWVLNLTNPLSLTTALMTEAGLAKTIGLCELPQVTAIQAAEILGVDPNRMEWQYIGLNHRGFITSLVADGSDRLAELPGRLGTESLGGVTPLQISQLGALPTKYFHIISGNITPPHRAVFLSHLRNKIAEELESHPSRTPTALAERNLAWYPQAVVPMLAALLSERPSLQTVNLMASDGVITENRAWVSHSGVELVPPPKPNPVVRAWLELYRKQEKAALACVHSPSLETLEEALRSDPVVSPESVVPATRAISGSYLAAAASGSEI